MATKYRYHASLTERWGNYSLDFREDRIAFERLSDAVDFFRSARKTSEIYLNPVRYCDCGCDHYHVCDSERRYIDVEQETAHLDIFLPDGEDVYMRLTYGPRGGVIIERN